MLAVCTGICTLALLDVSRNRTCACEAAVPLAYASRFVVTVMYSGHGRSTTYRQALGHLGGISLCSLGTHPTIP